MITARELAFTYQGEALEKRVRPLAESVGSRAGACPATSPTRPASTPCSRRWSRSGAGSISCVHAIAFSDKEELKGEYVDTSSTISSDHEDLLLLLHRAGQAGRAADEGWRGLADPDLLRRRARDAALQRDGRGQGGAGGHGALSGDGSRRPQYPRQRAVGRPGQDAGRLGHRRFPLYPEVEPVQFAAASAT